MSVIDNGIDRWLFNFFDRMTPVEFYREIFPVGELEKKGRYVDGQYTGILIGLSRQKKKLSNAGIMVPVVERFSVTDDLGVIADVGKRDDLFCLMSPISYAGKTREAEHARRLYAMAFDLDHIRFKDGEPVGLIDLWNGHVLETERVPKPTCIVSSGTGVHIYYIFDRPINLFPDVRKSLQHMKHQLTKMLWNEGVVDIDSDKDIQYEGIYQGFRVPGTLTKNGGRAEAYLTGNKVSIDYLNSFVDSQNRVSIKSYSSSTTLVQAKEKWPEWYEERIIEKKKGVMHPWAVSRRLYDWWKRKILKEAKVGHRYYCLMMLSIYAVKCGNYDEKKNPNPVSREELEKDAYEIMEYFEKLTVSDDNHFDAGDVLDALDAYDEKMTTYPRKSVEYLSGIEIPETKRNYRKQKTHLKLMAAHKAILKESGELKKEGRPSMQPLIEEWQRLHPNGTKKECMKSCLTGKGNPVSRRTVYKYWKDSKIQ